MRPGIDGGVLKLLSDEQIHRIHLTTLRILEKVGLRINHPATLQLLKNSGADVDASTCMAKVPSHMVEEAISKAPKSVMLCGRNPNNDFELRGNKVFFGLGSGTPMILDPMTNEWRPSKKRDVENAARLADALPNIDFVMGLGTPGDVNPDVVGLHEADAMMRNTEKHMVLYGYHGKEATREIIRMGEVVLGGIAELEKRPIFTLYAEPLSPLTFEGRFLESLMEFAKHRLPVIWGPGPGPGATSPITLAGSIAQGNAESLGGNLIMQLVSPGAPFVYYVCPMPMDMRTMVLSYGAPEKILMDAAISQLAHYYQLPAFGVGGTSDSSVPDGQGVAEATTSLLMATLSGANLIHDIGYLESGRTGSYEMVVICDELIRSLKRILKGIDLTDETLAFEAIRAVGAGGSFLQLRHTLDHFQTEYVYPELMSRWPRGRWEKLGSKDLNQRAREKVQHILTTHKIELDNAIIRRLDEIVTGSGHLKSEAS